MKALFEYFKDDLEGEIPTGTRSAVELAEFQEDAVKKARRILSRYDGVMIADSVGLGKTWIGKKLLEDFAYHMRQKAIVVCPASLRDMWTHELRDASISAMVLSQEEFGRAEFEPEPWGDSDVILIDESHNFRNATAQRYGNLERVLSGNGGRGRDGSRKKVILLSATPINNDLFDLHNQINLITQGDRGYFSACGIGDLYRYFLRARRDARTNGPGPVSLFNLLEEIVIRRTRHFIRTAYPEATIEGKKIHFPQRKLRTIKYDLEATYAGIYDEVVSGIESLKLAPYNLESYKKAGVDRDDFEAGREQALVGIFKSRYLKRFESSIDAFRISVRRALAFIKTFESYILDGRILQSAEFHNALRFIERENEEDDATPISLAEEMDTSEEARDIMDQMEEIDPGKYDLRKLHDALQHDVEVLNRIWDRVKDIGPDKDAKLARLKVLLSTELKGQKVLLFSYYKDTARYLYRELGGPEGEEFRESLDDVKIRRIDSGAGPKDRTRIIQEFAPIANEMSDWAGTDKEIDILISTDVLSEGQNLQDCGHLVNYDLHWNPTRMVQRAGRIDRIGTEFDTLWIFNMFPDEGLEKLLRLVERLSQRIADIDQVGLMDASVLGEAVHPRTFNTLRRIRDEDGSVIREEEEFSELASSEFLAQQLRGLLDAGGREMLESLPDGIHSGLVKPDAKGVFFYFQARDSGSGKDNFWRYYDLKDDRIIDNRYLVANLIACQKDTPRVVDPEVFEQVFNLQEKIIENILESVQQQEALEAVPRQVDPIQQTVSTVIQGYIDHPDVDRRRAMDAIRFLNQPMIQANIRELRQAYKAFQSRGDIQALLDKTTQLQTESGKEHTEKQASENGGRRSYTRDDLRLICFDILTG